jgi:hypothetical protein
MRFRQRYVEKLPVRLLEVTAVTGDAGKKDFTPTTPIKAAGFIPAAFLKK